MNYWKEKKNNKHVFTLPNWCILAKYKTTHNKRTIEIKHWYLVCIDITSTTIIIQQKNNRNKRRWYLVCLDITIITSHESPNLESQSLYIKLKAISEKTSILVALKFTIIVGVSKSVLIVITPWLTWLEGLCFVPKINSLNLFFYHYDSSKNWMAFQSFKLDVHC